MGFLIDWLLPAALAFMMLSLGISLTPSDFLRVAKRPKAFAVGAFAQLVLLPATAYGVALAFGLPPELALGLFILALCPGGPTSNLFSKLAGGDIALSVSLTGVITVVTVFTLPPLVVYAGEHFLATQATPVSVLPVAIRAIIVMLIPISFGMWLRHKAPIWVSRNEGRITIVAVMLITAVILASLIGQWTNFVTWFPVLGGACLAVLLIMLASGLIFGRLFKLNTAEATAISIDSAMQNAVMGITIGAIFATGGEPITAASLPSGIYGIMMYFVCMPFVLWRRAQTGK